MEGGRSKTSFYFAFGIAVGLRGETPFTFGTSGLQFDWTTSNPSVVQLLPVYSNGVRHWVILWHGHCNCSPLGNIGPTLVTFLHFATLLLSSIGQCWAGMPLQCCGFIMSSK
jgi:hypothetical protein